MIFLDVEQGSEEWFEARCGVATASSFDKIITPAGKKSTQSKAYMNKLLAEHMTRQKTTMKSSASMERGVELEEKARDYYELVTGDTVNETGLIYKDESKLVSCSPDGLLIGKGLEIKCPEQHTHVEYLLNECLPNKYIPQVQGSMWVTGLDEWDFLSFHPDLPALLITVKKDNAFHNLLDKYLSEFVSEMIEKRSKLNSLTIR